MGGAVKKWGIRYFIALFFALVVFQTNVQGKNTTYTESKLSFTVIFNQISIPYPVFATYILPKQKVSIEVNSTNPNHQFSIEGNKHLPFSKINKKSWNWETPKEEGIYPVIIKNKTTGEQTKINVFIMTPSSQTKNGKLHNYAIGSYPSNAKKHTSYQLPKGFIKVTEANKNTKIAPHFTLKQFLCKQTSQLPQYIVLQEKLILKLEWLLEQVNKKGIRATSFHIMSGYRTPHYNRRLGNVSNSRHIYGDAADIFIDEDNNGIMDDINGDGKINHLDVNVLYEIIEQSHHHANYKPFVGGLGRYRSNNRRGPFIHIDTRGFKARWGG